ncbi:MAG: hypothetical protein KHZ24_05120 [Coriobacteriia bacterium]|nr:hypothetical protein [Coriobacteriia bacterium]
MKRTTLVSPEETAYGSERGSLKLFFSYAPFAGTTTALLDEVQGMEGRGKDVFIAELTVPGTGERRGVPFDVDQVLKRRPDLVALDDFAAENPSGSRNRYRYQDALELLHAGINVYAELSVANLENEADRVMLVTDRRPGELVPDYLFYTAQQVEFVDIDPQELIERCQAAGRPVDDVKVLRQLRVLALQCVSQYATSSTTTDAAARRAVSFAPRESVVAIVSPGMLPAAVLREAAALAGAVHAPLRAVCAVRERREGSHRASGDERSLARLAEQVEAMGFEFEVIYGADEAETVRDYLRAQGISDVVVARRPVSRARRLLLPVQPTFVDRMSEGLLGVRLHVVDAEMPAGRAQPVIGRGVATLLDFRASHLLAASVVSVLAAALGLGAAVLGLPEVASSLVWVLAVALVAGLTRSYLPAALSIVLAGVLHARVVAPLHGVEGASRGVDLVLLLVTLSVIAFVVVRLERSARQARRREQHTQALYELNRRLLSVRGLVDVVDVSLDAIVRLFDRSAVFYVADPLAVTGEMAGIGAALVFAGGAAPEAPSAGPTGSNSAQGALRAHRTGAVRAVPGDLGEREFNKITERNIAHWVFVNGAEAGSGTHTSETSDVRYIPLVMDEEVIGVIGISARRRLSLGEESFLQMVADQVLNALERQALSMKHLADMRGLRVGSIRDAFMGRLVASVNRSAGTIAELSHMLQAARSEDAEYREELEQAVGIESLRSRIMVGRVLSDLEEEPRGVASDLRAIVSDAVERSRQGHGSTLIDLEPGGEAASLVVDRELVETAATLVIEASLAFAPVGSIVTVSVAEHPERFVVSVADDRPDPLAGQPAALAPGYDADRASDVVAFFSDRASVLSDVAHERLARAMRVPPAACTIDGRVDLRRAQRFDRVAYGLYVAALIVRAHNGEIKTRHRLGGGAVTSFSLPRE